MSRTKLLIVVALAAVFGLVLASLTHGRRTQLVYIFVSGFMFFFAFDPNRTRQTWSKAAFCIVGGLLVAHTAVRFLMISHVMGTSFRSALSIESVLSSTRGVILGLLIALLLSGEAFGKPVKE